MRVRILPPDGPPQGTVTLRDGEALLVGRDPELAPDSPASTRLLPVASPMVSSTHALLWSDGDGLHVRDLESKNGTLLGVDRGGVATLRGLDEATVYLAAPRGPLRSASLREFAVADADLATFAERLRDAVADWFVRGGFSVTVDVARTDADRAPDATGDGERFTIPLTQGLALQVVDADSGKTRLRWDGVKAEVFSGVYEQVARWRACRAATPRGPIAFASPGAGRALREVLDAARLQMPLVLRGESGTGKTALAAIYAGRESIRPGRRDAPAGTAGGAPFVTVHCAHLDPPLAHATLFGALKGSYTSSERTVLGAVKHADEGVLFLDDVDALPLETQAKLLRFLDDGAYEPLGHSSRDPLVANVRVVVGTNADLRAAVRERRFREDLYWRLHMGAVVRVPPLRERPEDVERLLSESPGFAPSAGEGSVRERLQPSAIEFLVSRHPWQGNFRECLRFCARVRMEPPSGPLDRRRCEEILAEASLDPEGHRPAGSERPALEAGATSFDRALRQAVQWWVESEGATPERFDELGRFCESYLKSAFVAHALGLAEADARPEVFDRDRRQALGCDLTTLKRKIDDYLALRRGHPPTDA